MSVIARRAASIRVYASHFYGLLSGSEYSVPAEPQLDPETRFMLGELMVRSNGYLEYGSGGSTLLAARLVGGPITSVEGDRRYLSAVLRALGPAGNGKVSLLRPKMGPTGPWGRPLSFPRSEVWSRYPQMPWNVMTYVPDLILVDGRFRVACTLESMLRLPDRWPGALIVDDFDERPAYQVLEQLAPSAARVGRALLIRMVGDWDRARASAILESHYTDWH